MIVLHPFEAEAPVSFALYLIGFLVFVAGIAWALATAGVPRLYIMIAAVILVGLGIVTGVGRTRRRDPS
jgi:hypothetical protein